MVLKVINNSNQSEMVMKKMREEESERVKDGEKNTFFYSLCLRFHSLRVDTITTRVC